MVKKRYLMILSLAITSIIFGSFLYNNVTFAGKPEPQPSVHKDAVEITVLDWTARYYQSGSSVSSEIGLTWWIGAMVDFPFVFTPKGSVRNVTRLWITLVVNSRSGDGFTNAKAKINNNFTVNFDNMLVNDVFPLSNTRNLEHDPVLNAIYPGINLLQLYDRSDYDLLIYRITLFIEYEYLA